MYYVLGCLASSHPVQEYFFNFGILEQLPLKGMKMDLILSPTALEQTGILEIVIVKRYMEI